VGIGEPSRITTSLQHFTNQAFMVEWPDGSHSSVKALDSPLGLCQKAPKGLSDDEKQDSAPFHIVVYLIDVSMSVKQYSITVAMHQNKNTIWQTRNPIIHLKNHTIWQAQKRLDHNISTIHLSLRKLWLLKCEYLIKYIYILYKSFN
jgi:hypothetical protein